MNIEEVTRGARDALSVKRVFGDPYEGDGVTVIPAATVTGGGGGGGDNAPDGGSGGGFGLIARPAGVYVIRDGEVSWQPALDLNRAIIGGQVVALVMLLTLRSVLSRRAKARKAAARR